MLVNEIWDLYKEVRESLVLFCYLRMVEIWKCVNIDGSFKIGISDLKI